MLLLSGTFLDHSHVTLGCGVSSGLLAGIFHFTSWAVAFQEAERGQCCGRMSRWPCVPRPPAAGLRPHCAQPMSTWEHVIQLWEASVTFSFCCCHFHYGQNMSNNF